MYILFLEKLVSKFVLKRLAESVTQGNFSFSFLFVFTVTL